MEEISFKVQGSASEPYETVFIKRTDTNLSAYCSCPAGQKGQYCKHRFSILDGLTKDITSNNIEQVETVQLWLPGTDLESALLKMRQLETEAMRIKKNLASAKKDVAKAMRD